MPEGDTIHKIARYLDEALRDQPLERVWISPRFGRAIGRCRSLAVASEGKHLLLMLDNGLQLRSHLGMYGSWHQYPKGARWQKPRRQAVILIETTTRQFVCFNAREVQWVNGRQACHENRVEALGPDLIRDGCCEEEILRRVSLYAGADRLLVDVLLDQHIAAGIGNVFKSESLFVAGYSPQSRCGDLDRAELLRLYEIAADLLGGNLGGVPRTTREQQDGHGRLWVYARWRLPCLRCGTPILRDYLGDPPRSTYWCPRCQPD